MTLREDLANALAQMALLMGDGRTAQTFTWRKPGNVEVQIDCVPSSIGKQLIIDGGGNEALVDLTLFVKRDTLLTADSTLVTIDSNLYTADAEGEFQPVSGRKVEFRGSEYRIITARESGPRSHFEITCKDAASNG